MLPRVRKQEVIANNMANVNTSGFKKESLFLRLVQSEQAKKSPLTPSWEVKMADGIYTDFSPGSLEATKRDLDVAIEGDGFFVVQTPDGEAYTRNGSLSLTPEGLLVNSEGYPILTDGGAITVLGGEVAIENDGTISVDEQSLGRLLVVDFPKPYELTKAGKSLFLAPDGVAAIEPETTYVRQGYLETSNVDVLREMVDMIGSFRSFEMGQKMIQIQDETLSKTVNEVPKVR